MPTRVKSPQKLRMEIAAVAAKIIAAESVADYRSAKRKAAIQLGLAPNKNMPSNQEIENALINYQTLFQSDMQWGQLKSLRLQAIQAMKMLHRYKPLLVGPVATGTATSSSEIVLHLYSDQVEQIGLFLAEQGIPNKICEKHIRINATKTVIYPAYRFIADQTAIMLVIFSENDKNLSPVSSINNKAMLMLSRDEVIEIAEDSGDWVAGRFS